MGWVSNWLEARIHLVTHGLGCGKVDDDKGLLGLFVLVDTRDFVTIEHGIDEIVTYAQAIGEPSGLLIARGAHVYPAARLDRVKTSERAIVGLQYLDHDTLPSSTFPLQVLLLETEVVNPLAHLVAVHARGKAHAAHPLSTVRELREMLCALPQAR